MDLDLFVHVQISVHTLIFYIAYSQYDTGKVYSEFVNSAFKYNNKLYSNAYEFFIEVFFLKC